MIKKNDIKECGMFSENNCARNCCNARAERVKGDNEVLKWLGSHLVKLDDWRLPAFTITQGEFSSQLKVWGYEVERDTRYY